MSYGFCFNSDEHKREAQEDFNRYGRYGYDSEKYNDHWSDCNRAYRDGFDESVMQEDRRREEQEQKERDERHHQRQMEEHRQIREWEEMQMFEQMYRQQEQQYPEPPTPEPSNDSPF